MLTSENQFDIPRSATQSCSQTYVLFTVAYNEEKRIDKVIRSVLGQTLPPTRWIIVSDGSTDNTDAIVKRYAEMHEFIRFARQEKRSDDVRRLDKVTIAQARAMALAREMVKDVDHTFFGNLDADITFEPDYYERLIERMCEDPEIGIGGGGAFSVRMDGTV